MSPWAQVAIFAIFSHFIDQIDFWLVRRFISIENNHLFLVWSTACAFFRFHCLIHLRTFFIPLPLIIRIATDRQIWHVVKRFRGLKTRLSSKMRGPLLHLPSLAGSQRSPWPPPCCTAPRCTPSPGCPSCSPQTESWLSCACSGTGRPCSGSGLGDT